AVAATCLWPVLTPGPLSPFPFALPPLLARIFGLQSVDAAPAGLESDLAARAEALALDLGDDRRARVARRRMEDREEAARNQVEDAALVGRQPLDVVADVGRDDRVVVVDLRVVDDPRERQLVEAHHEARSLLVVGDPLQRRGD